MEISAQVTINAPINQVWAAVADIENAATRISGIDAVEILAPASDGLVGLKWRETRTLFGKTATEVMWITDAVENEFYDTRAESHGSIYRTRISVAQDPTGTTLTMRFRGEPVTFVAKLFTVPMGWMVKGSMRKVVQQDLEDIKKAVEAAP